MTKKIPEKNIEELQRMVIRFRDERNWKQFNNPKDVSLSLVLEATEVMEHFQWKDDDHVRSYVSKNKSAIGDELADVLYWILLMSNDLEINLSEALKVKLKKNELKYPIQKAKNKPTKYNKL